jgi:RNA polymerase sigma factor (sigma-70 family)
MFLWRVLTTIIATLKCTHILCRKTAGDAGLKEQDKRDASDRSLLRRFRVGEQDAATRLYLRYANRLHRLATAQTGQDLKARFDPEDIVQSVFRTFFRRARAGYYDVPDDEELWKLFLVIGLHKIRDAAVFHRAAKRDVARTVRLPDSQLNEHAAANEVAETTLRLVIEELLSSLTESQRDIVTRRLNGEAVGDIAKQTGRAQRTVERTLQKFRQILHENAVKDFES